ncbi:hypothetical protein INT43_006676 [Umbelopsis isabellina]|uniref:Rho GTPase-activating protein 39 n=1 Tax=Mortierella isabellina TaxID=91625 RepID=A0A8H7UL04_MORIS|nr:hypothetical protein INT43_006676 [Umbelopsis isabellina]
MVATYDWVEIIDPQSKDTFFANPLATLQMTGECLWQRPETGTTKPEDPEGDWWELWDENNQLPYYYNTLTGSTEWVRPENKVIIPLMKIQQNSSIGKRMSDILSAHNDAPNFQDQKGSVPLEHQQRSPSDVSNPSAQPNTTSFEATPSVNVKRHSRSLDLPVSDMKDSEWSGIRHQRSNSDTISKDIPSVAATPFMEVSTSPGLAPEPLASALPASPSTGNSSIFGIALGRKQPFGARKQSLRGIEQLPETTRSTKPARQSQFPLSRASIESAFQSLTKSYRSNSTPNVSKNIETKPLPKRSISPISEPVVNTEAAAAMNPLNQANHDAVPPIPPPHAKKDIPTLPVNLQREITQFAIDGFAQKYFSTHKKGLFRRKVPREKMLQWTKDSIKQPLMILNKDLHKDALKSFKLIQMIMGDRSRPRNSSANEDLQWLCNCGITKGQMRDEIYVQVCKQLNNNPNSWSVLKGWEILCVITITFPPSKNLESYLDEFVKQHHTVTDNKMDVMSRHVSSKLERICTRGAKGKVLTFAEIERAKDAPFKPSVFGESLEFIMEQQASTTDMDIPKIVPFLANMVLDLNGLYSEGIFRVPGDADDVTELRIRIENGRYDAAGVTDPNVPASLLKYWLRDLAEPLIFTEFYESCIKHSENIDQAIEVIRQLPEVNRRIVLYLADFLTKFTDPESTKLTRMNVNNLAMVFAPNFLRCPYESLTQVFENSKWEQAFLRTLIENAPLLHENL